MKPLFEIERMSEWEFKAWVYNEIIKMKSAITTERRRE